jgi:type I restriction enzyme S subunit
MGDHKYTIGELCIITKGITGIQKAIAGEYTLVVTSEERKSHNEYQFDDEAVIVPLVSGTGHGHASIKRIHYQTGKFALGSILCAIIPRNRSILNSAYLYRFLNLNKENELVARMKGMANVTLPIKEIAKIPIPLPPLTQQLEFVEKYNSLEVDSKSIDLEFQNQLALVKQLRQAFLSEAMQGKINIGPLLLEKAEEGTVTGERLLAIIKAEKTQLIKDNKLKNEKELPPIKSKEIPFDLPQDWSWCRLGAISNYGSSPKAEPKHLLSSTWILDLEDIEKETSRLISKIRFLDRKSLSTKSVFRKGELLYSKLRPYLDKVIVADEDGVCTTEILPVKFYGNINSHFIKYSMKRIDFLNYVNSVTKGMKMPRLGTTDGRMALIPLPPLSLQNQIVAKLDELMIICDNLENSIKQCQVKNEHFLQQVLKEALEVKAEIIA